MKKLIKTVLKSGYVQLINLRFKLRHRIFGYDYAVKLFEIVPDFVLIPMLRKCGASIGENCRIESPLRIHRAPGRLNNFKIGNNVAISKGLLIDLGGMIEIGSNVTLAMDVSLVTHEHYANVYIEKKSIDKAGAIFIDSNVYIGTKSVVLCGVTICNSVIVGAKSLVNKNLFEDGTYVGTPVRKLIK